MIAEAYTVPTGVVPKAMPAGAVGDVNSTARGSGARFNAGKASLELVPLTVMATALKTENTPALDALFLLGRWQETGELHYLHQALRSLGPKVWEDCAAVFDYGRRKYAEWNWAKGMQWSIPTACAARHLLAAARGEALDAESGHSHAGHAACNIVMLLTFARTYPEGDDRPRFLADPAPIQPNR